MKILFFFIFYALICYIHITSSESSKKEKDKTFPKNPNINTAKPKHKNKEDRTKTKDHGSKKAPNIRTPFDKVLEKLSNCAVTSTLSPSIAEVMEENLKELQTDEKYISLFNAAPHTAAFLQKKKRDSTKFISGLRQALNADWSSPAWKSYEEIDTLFRPLKQQFVYTMMRFNCT